MMRNIQWGIIGLGKISRKFVQDLLLVEDSELYGVASRTIDKAEKFREEFSAIKAYGSYQEMFDDPNIDIVYIGTPHDSHAELSIQAMRSGKNVLCEKPLAVNKAQVEEIINVANETGMFMMEAFWSRFNPTIREVLERARKGDLGDVNYVNADFTYARNDADDSRMLNPALAGGSLLDMGVYPVFLAYSVLGYPSEIKSVGILHTTGVDLQTASVFNYKDAVANVMSGFRGQSKMQATIIGTKGTITIHPIWHETQGYSFLDLDTGKETSYNRPTRGKGFTYEIAECNSCIKEGRAESDLWPLKCSLDMLSITDEIRKQVGVKYPFEK